MMLSLRYHQALSLRLCRNRPGKIEETHPTATAWVRYIYYNSISNFHDNRNFEKNTCLGGTYASYNALCDQ